jgi:hypothetical protein
MLRRQKNRATRRGRRGVGIAVTAGILAGTAIVLPAEASFTTRIYGMTCDTGYDDTNGKGWGTCYAPGPSKWKIRVNCAWGLTYDSYWVITGPDEWYTLRYPANCWFGANSVTVVETTS